MSLDQTTTIQNFYGPFEAVFVLTLFIIIAGIPLVLYYYERTGQLPRVVQRRMEHVEDSVRRFRGRDVMGISTIIA